VTITLLAGEFSNKQVWPQEQAEQMMNMAEISLRDTAEYCHKMVTDSSLPHHSPGDAVHPSALCAVFR
jgi:hypothetical protein